MAISKVITKLSTIVATLMVMTMGMIVVITMEEIVTRAIISHSITMVVDVDMVDMDAIHTHSLDTSTSLLLVIPLMIFLIPLLMDLEVSSDLEHHLDLDLTLDSFHTVMVSDHTGVVAMVMDMDATTHTNSSEFGTTPPLTPQLPPP